MHCHEVMVKSALLYDVGTLVCRTRGKTEPLIDATTAFLAAHLKASPEKDAFLAALRGDKEQGESRTAALLREAHRIALGMNAGSNTPQGKESLQPLQSIFTHFGGHTQTEGKGYPLLSLYNDNRIAFPEDVKGIEIKQSEYDDLLKRASDYLERRTVEDMQVNELLAFLEESWSYVPAEEGQTDISLYVKAKITAAVASCLHLFEETKAAEELPTDFETEKAFLLLSGDFSGIQNFIYTIPSKGALKSLRGRSFYLEIFLENVIDELLEALRLFRANLLYGGGGHFYILAPHTEEAEAAIGAVSRSCNAWLLERFGTKLYIAFGQQSCSAAELMNPESHSSVFAGVSQSLAMTKMQRYEEDDLARLFSENSDYTMILDGSRECSVCHTSTATIRPMAEIDGEVCDMCASLFDLGAAIIDNPDSFLAVVQATEKRRGTPLWSMRGEASLCVLTTAETDALAKEDRLIRLYSKNTLKAGHPEQKRLWVADHVTKHDGKVYTFADLAASSVGDGYGINRLGVMRADVDNLGAAFISGFIGKDAKKKHTYSSLARQAELSEQMSLFFKRIVNQICQGRLEGDVFTLYDKDRPASYKVHAVYSGGDDMFFVGAWDELIALAVNIRKAFAIFTEGKLTFSAGIALFSPSYPISKMAEITGMLEDFAKDRPTKDSVALFGVSTEVGDADEQLHCRHIFRWDELADSVCNEKLGFLFRIWDIKEGRINGSSLGKSFIYRLMDFIEAVEDDVKQKRPAQNLARFLYALARLEPKDKKNKDEAERFSEFSTTMYKWVKNERDRLQLLTALHLLVYYLRDTERA